MWSWANEHTLEKVKKATQTIKDYGANLNFSKFTDEYFPSDEFEAWEFTAIAALLTNAIGVYRPVNDDGLKKISNHNKID